MSDRRMQALRWLPVTVVTIIWLIGTHLPPPQTPRLPTGDKLAHFVGYLLIGMLLAWALRLDRRPPRATMLAWMGLLGLGALDELTQPLVRRSAGWDDFLANAAGAIVGLLLARTLLRMTPRKGDGSA